VALEEVILVSEFDKLNHARACRIVDWSCYWPIDPEVHVSESHVTNFGDPYGYIISKVNILWKLKTSHLV
jgi:hypothetical protein